MIAALRATFARTAAAIAAWWALADGEWPSSPLALGAVVLAVATSLRLTPPTASRASGARPARAWHAACFLAVFAAGTLLGTVDVARRVLRRRPAVEPHVVDLPLGAGRGSPVLLAFAMSVMPGTLVVRAQTDGLLRVHVLHPEIPAEAMLRRLERHAAGAAGRLAAERSGDG